TAPSGVRPLHLPRLRNNHQLSRHHHHGEHGPSYRRSSSSARKPPAPVDHLHTAKPGLKLAISKVRPRSAPLPQEGDLCITSQRFADEEPVPGSLARTCPRSFGFVRQFLRRSCSSGLLASSSAHFAQDDTERHSLTMQRSPQRGRRPPTPSF